MIGVRLMGGLGNQMFQYAVGRALACRHKTELAIDISFYAGEQLDFTPRCFQLDRLKTTCQFLPTTDLPERVETGLSLIGRIGSVIKRVIPGQKSLLRYCERSSNYDPEFNNLKDNSYLDGYWQSEKYFRSISDMIRTEFVPVHVITGRNLETAQIIQACNAVSVHVRRGDYVTDPRVANVLSVFDQDYYHHCVQNIVEKVESPHFFIFSDDTDWARHNLCFPGPVTIVDHNSTELPVEDLRLMSLCKHNIIANSSLGWWGAWLNHNPEKVVIAPKKWFTGSDRLSADIIPAEWNRV